MQRMSYGCREARRQTCTVCYEHLSLQGNTCALVLSTIEFIEYGVPVVLCVIPLLWTRLGYYVVAKTLRAVMKTSVCWCNEISVPVGYRGECSVAVSYELLFLMFMVCIGFRVWL